MSGYAGTSPHHPVRPDWLARHHEPILEPGVAIVDAHHHLWDRPENPYAPADFLADAATGHAVEASVFIECGTHYRSAGPDDFRPVGEVEFAAGVAADADGTAACAAIVGHVDLTGDRVDAVVAAERDAAGGRLRGVRQIAAWHQDPAARASLAVPPPGLLADARFRAGAATLAAHGLALDVFVYHTQLAEIAALARAVPDLSIVLDHVGGPIGVGPYAGRRDEVFAAWHDALRAVAACPNVRVKLSGLGMRLFGFGFVDAPVPPGSEALAAAWRPYLATAIETFGVDRCMFGSNFPVDKGTCSYPVLWNAFKRIAAGMSADETAALFAGTARRTYRLAH